MCQELHLRRAEALLNQTMEDLMGKNSRVPGAGAAALLAQVLAELQTFSKVISENDHRFDKAAIDIQLRAFLQKLSQAECLLVAAADFYRGWCAAGFAPRVEESGYQSNQLVLGPSLLAYEG